jgi:hypothetical protein
MNVTKIALLLSEELTLKKNESLLLPIICSHSISLRILPLKSLVTRVLPSTVSAEILALMKNII